MCPHLTSVCDTLEAMIWLTILLDGDGAAQDLHDRGLKMIHLAEDSPPIRVAYLSGGMAGGKPSVSLIFELPENQYVVAETSAALFVAAANAIRTKANMDGVDL